MDHFQKELTPSLLADLHNMEGGSSLSESACKEHLGIPTEEEEEEEEEEEHEFYLVTHIKNIQWF